MAQKDLAPTTRTNAVPSDPADVRVSKEFLDSVLRKALRYDILVEQGVENWEWYGQAQLVWTDEEN